LKKNLVLTGMMGVGKSTVGKNLANKLSYSFIDVDKIIEEYEGSSIDIIFKNKGENYFRTIEYKITTNELNKKGSVISLGGGAFLDKGIRRRVKNSSVSFWLDINLNLLIKRLKKARKRPLLQGKNLIETVNKIYLARKKTYSEADHKINCKNLKPDVITNQIIKLYDGSKN
tara:strand:+ start:173 stop:688 length:516 start_codon:yes stop_codon:yes gene_type:complete